MDSWTINKLTEWLMPEYVIVKFREEEIDKLAFLSLTEEMLKELIPKIGLRSKFYKNLLALKINSEKVLQNEEIYHTAVNVNDINQFEIVEPEQITINNETVGSNQIDYIVTITDDQKHILKAQIQDILTGCADGNIVLQFYKSNNNLTHSMRNLVSSVVIKYELKDGLGTKITKNRFIDLAKGIEALFPTETGSTYFIPYDKHSSRANKGKLYDKYCNIRKKIKNIALATQHSSVVETTFSFDSNEEFRDQITWLKNNLEPKTVLYEYWEKTAMGRLKNTEFQSIILFPCLKSPLGPHLIELDFKFLFPNSEKSLLNKTDLFKEKFKRYVNLNKIKKLSENQINNIFEELINPSKVGNDDFALLYLLPYIFSPTTIKLQKSTTKRSCWRPSVIEQASAFIKFIATASDFKNNKIEVVNKAVAYGITVQPYVVIIGSILDKSDTIDCYVVLENIEYKIETPLKAVEICFKAFFTLNYKYPIEAEQIWLFIQTYFFEIKTPHDKTYQSINNIVNDLNNIN